MNTQPNYHIKDIIHWLQPQNYLRGIGILLSHLSFNLPVHGPNLHFNPNIHLQIPRVNPLLLLWLIPGYFLWRVVQSFLRNKKLNEESLVFLEVTPPSYADKTAFSTSELFSHLHGIGYTSKQDQLLAKAPNISLEIVSTKTEGIRYLIGVKPDHVDSVKRSLLSYLPEVKIKQVDCYIPQGYKRSEKFHSGVADYGLSGSFGFPLKSQGLLNEHDPVAFLTGIMTQLDPGELISFQMVLSPANLKERDKIKGMINRNEDATSYMKEPSYHWAVGAGLFILKQLGNLIAGAIEELGKFCREILSSKESIYIQRANDLEYIKRKELLKLERKVPTASQFEVNKVVMDKLNQSLFFVSLRLLVIAKDKKELRDRINGFSSFMDTFSFQGYQSLRKRRQGLLSLAFSKI